MKNNVKAEEANVKMDMDMEKVKNDITDIKQDISDIKNKKTVVVKEYNDRRIGFWGWLAISSVASSLAAAAVGIAKCINGCNDSNE